MEQILIGRDGEYIVIETGPRGIPGPPGAQGNPGPATPGSGRTGLEVVTPTIETYGTGEDAVSYDTFIVGLSNAQHYVAAPVGNHGRPVLIRINAEASIVKAQEFLISFFGTLPETEIYFDATGEGLDIALIPAWVSSDGSGAIALKAICLPAAYGGSGSDFWIPTPYSVIVPRVGNAYGILSAADGDGTTTPDATLDLTKINANVSALNVDAGSYLYPAISLMNISGSRPLRLEITNADAVVKFDIIDLKTESTVTFDPDALGLRSGTSILGTVHVISTSPTTATVVVDPIGGGA